MVVKRPHLKKSKQDIQLPSCSRHFVSVRIGVSGDIGNIHQIRNIFRQCRAWTFSSHWLCSLPALQKNTNQNIVNQAIIRPIPLSSGQSLYPPSISHLTLLPNEFVNLILPLCMKMRRDANQRRGTWKTRHLINFGDDEIVFLLAARRSRTPGAIYLGDKA